MIQYLVARRYPRSFARYIVWPVVFGAAGMIPPATLYYLWQYVIVGLIFNYFIRRRFLGWWSKSRFMLNKVLFLTDTLVQLNTTTSSQVVSISVPLFASSLLVSPWV